MQKSDRARERKGDGEYGFTGTVTSRSTHETKRAASDFKSASPSAFVIGGLILSQADDGWHACPYPIVFTFYYGTNKYDSFLSERTQKAKPLAKVKKKIVIWRGASGE